MIYPRLMSRIHVPSEKGIRLFLMRFYLVGALGFMLPFSYPLFVTLIPFALLFCLGIILYYELTANRKRKVTHFLVFISVVYFVSFLIEMAGVNTGLIFGSYQYGGGLGIQLFNTPLMIGVNWILVVLGSAGLAHRISTLLGFSETHYIDTFFRIIAASILMILFDVVLERTAPLLEMWNWNTPRVPGRNYLAWFALSFLFQSYYVGGKIQQRTRIASTIFLLQLLFFSLILLYSTFLFI
ncbi:MAG: carotenoid biosynthesis protein [Bacteroidales bacterium]